MYCNNCGAMAVGKYCSCCGKRLRSEVEAFNRVMTQERKAFSNWACREADGVSNSNMHLANACWYACQIKFAKDVTPYVNGVFVLMPDAYEKLALVKTHAMTLYKLLKTVGY